jgi:hypothetical protein
MINSVPALLALLAGVLQHTHTRIVFVSQTVLALISAVPLSLPTTCRCYMSAHEVFVSRQKAAQRIGQVFLT